MSTRSISKYYESIVRKHKLPPPIKWQARGTNVWVYVGPTEEIMGSGLRIPDDAKHHIDVGIVASVGPQAYKDLIDGKPWCEVGEIIKFIAYDYKEVIEDGGLYFIIRDKDVIGAYENE